MEMFYRPICSHFTFSILWKQQKTLQFSYALKTSGFMRVIWASLKLKFQKRATEVYGLGQTLP